MIPRTFRFMLVLAALGLFPGCYNPGTPLATDKNNAKYLDLRWNPLSGTMKINGTLLSEDIQSLGYVVLPAVGKTNFLVEFLPATGYGLGYFTVKTDRSTIPFYSNPAALMVENTSILCETLLASSPPPPPGTELPSILRMRQVRYSNFITLDTSYSAQSYLYDPLKGTFFPGEELADPLALAGGIVSVSRSNSSVDAELWNDGQGKFSLFSSTYAGNFTPPCTDSSGVWFFSTDEAGGSTDLLLKHWDWKTAKLTSLVIQPDAESFLPDITYFWPSTLSSEDGTIWLSFQGLIYRINSVTGICSLVTYPSYGNAYLSQQVILSTGEVLVYRYRDTSDGGTETDMSWMDKNGKTRPVLLLKPEDVILSSGTNKWFVLRESRYILAWQPVTSSLNLIYDLGTTVDRNEVVSSWDGETLYRAGQSGGKAILQTYSRSTGEIKTVPGLPF